MIFETYQYKQVKRNHEERVHTLGIKDMHVLFLAVKGERNARHNQVCHQLAQKKPFRSIDQ
jgi:hypothetical protein